MTNMALLLLVTVMAVATSPAELIRYTVSFAERAAHDFRVTLEAPAPVGRSSLEIAMPRWSTGGSQIGDFAAYVQALEAFGPNDIPLRTSKVDLHTWRIELGGASRFEIRYRVHAESPARVYASDLAETGGFLDPAASLVYIQASKGRPIEGPIELRLVDVPADWQVATALAVGSGPLTYRAESYDRLVESPLLAGKLQLREFGAGPARVTVAFDPAGPDLDLDAMTRTAEKLVHVFSQMFGELPFSRFVFLYRLPDRPGSSGMERWNSTTIQLPYSRVTRSLEDFNDITAHQFFHLWNTMRIRPAIKVRPDYSQEVLTRSLWFSEGATRYYAKLGRLRAGLLPEDRFLETQASEILLHQSRPARLFQSLEDASWNAPFSVNLWYRAQSNSIEYGNKGALVSFLLDLAIRDATDGRRSLDDVMRAMNERFGRTARGYGETADILATVNDVAGRDMAAFFEDYVRGTKDLEYGRFLKPAGLDLVEVRRRALDPGFWAERAFGVPVMLVTRVTPGSAAERAGVRNGDEFVGLDDTDIDAGLEMFLARYDAGQAATGRFRRGGQPYTVPLEMREASKDEVVYRLRRVGDPNDRQRRIWNGMIAAAQNSMP